MECRSRPRLSHFPPQVSLEYSRLPKQYDTTTGEINNLTSKCVSFHVPTCTFRILSALAGVYFCWVCPQTQNHDATLPDSQIKTRCYSGWGGILAVILHATLWAVFPVLFWSQVSHLFFVCCTDAIVKRLGFCL